MDSMPPQDVVGMDREAPRYMGTHRVDCHQWRDLHQFCEDRTPSGSQPLLATSRRLVPLRLQAILFVFEPVLVLPTIGHGGAFQRLGFSYLLLSDPGVATEAELPRF
jgi:hypothetical protein